MPSSGVCLTGAGRGSCRIAPPSRRAGPGKRCPDLPGCHPTDPDSFLKSARLQRLPSTSSEMGSQDGSPLRETRKDPFSAAAAECSCRQDGLTVIVTACLTFATGVTVALVMQIYFGDPQVRGFHEGQREGTEEEGVRKFLRRPWGLWNG